MLLFQVIFLHIRIINKDSLFQNAPFPNHLSSDQDYQQRFAFSKCSFSKSYFFRSGLSIKIRFFKMFLFQSIFLQIKIIDHGTAGRHLRRLDTDVGPPPQSQMKHDLLYHNLLYQTPPTCTCNRLWCSMSPSP